jgi:DNA-binding response OmpR family regulator
MLLAVNTPRDPRKNSDVQSDGALDGRLRCLLYCVDPEVFRMMRTVIEEGNMSVELCTQAHTTLAQISNQVFQAMVIDFDLHDAIGVLQQSRKRYGSSRFIALAMTSTDTKSPMDAGATLVVHKPISMERARGAVRLLRNLVVGRDRQQRRQFEQELPAPEKKSSSLRNLKLSS